MEKILCISGILTKKDNWNGWIGDLNKKFNIPEVIGDTYYLPFQIGKISEALEKGLEIVDDKTIIIAHSFGGLIARAIANKKSNLISRLILMGCPHLLGLNSLLYSGVLGDLTVPEQTSVHTYGAKHDYVVWTNISKGYGAAKYTELEGTHSCFLYNPKVRAEIITRSLH